MFSFKCFFLGAVLAMASTSASLTSESVNFPTVPLAHRLHRDHPTRASLTHDRRYGIIRRTTGPVASVNNLIQTLQLEFDEVLPAINSTLAGCSAANAAAKGLELTALLIRIQVQLDETNSAAAQIRAAPTTSGTSGGCEVVDNGILDSLLAVIVDLEYTLLAVENLWTEIPLFRSLFEDSIQSVIQIKTGTLVTTLGSIFACLKTYLVPRIENAGLGSLVGVIV